MTDAPEAENDVDDLHELDQEGWVIQRESQIVVIYPNGDGDIVVKEIVHAFPRAVETVIVIARNNVRDAVAAMLRAAELDDCSLSAPVVQAAAQDRTGAERQRRRRAKQRDDRDKDRDSDRDSVTVAPSLRRIPAGAANA